MVPTAAAQVSVHVPGGGKDAALLPYKVLPPRLCGTHLQAHQQHQSTQQAAAMQHYAYGRHIDLDDDSSTCSSDDELEHAAGAGHQR